MPNHFHLMVLVNNVEIKTTHQMTSSHQMSNPGTRTLKESLEIMFRSYTRAINKQQSTSGSLFRPHTKAECVNCPTGLIPSFITVNGITSFNNEQPEQQYPQICFNYIHQNPVKAGLVSRAEEWEFSSAVDYAGLRNGSLINREVAGMYVQAYSSGE